MTNHNINTVMNFPVFKKFGSNAVLLEWPELISREIQAEVSQYSNLVEDLLYQDIIETVMTYQSLAIYLRKEVNIEDFIDRLSKMDLSEYIIPEEGRIMVIPVCYERNMAEDIEHICFHTGLTEAEIITLHSEVTYDVAFIGFLPGFAYLNGLPRSLNVPRRKTPRRKVPKGAVAIGGQQTGIYPMESPGGWNIIGRCPLELFDINKTQPCLLKAGDRIRFQQITESVFQEISDLSNKGLYQTQTIEL